MSPVACKSVLQEKSFQFAVEIVALADMLYANYRGFRLADQILGSGTSIGANIREAGQAESAADFIHKLSIALKECDETIYWLDLLSETGRLAPEHYAHHLSRVMELRKMLTASIKTVKTRTKRTRKETSVATLRSPL